MQTNEIPQFIQMLHNLCEMYGKPRMSDEVAMLHFGALQDYSLEDVRKGFFAAMRNPDSGQFMPRPADVIRELSGSSDTRAQSIANGIAHLLAQRIIQPSDTLLVHDAARCCLPQSALNRLLDALDNDPHAQQHGALLAIPVADTLKRQATPHLVHSAQTIPREGIWQAQTPQAFQAALLHRALSQSDLSQITDDASAVEQLGLQPALVTGDSRNIKLTRPDDAALAEYFLQQAA